MRNGNSGNFIDVQGNEITKKGILVPYQRFKTVFGGAQSRRRDKYPLQTFFERNCLLRTKSGA